MRGRTEKLKGGYKLEYYVSYVFGGLVQEADGRLSPTNDLIEVVTKDMVVDKTQTDVEAHMKPHIGQTNHDEAQVSLI